MFVIITVTLYEACLVVHFTSLVLDLFVTCRFVKEENYVSHSHLNVTILHSMQKQHRKQHAFRKLQANTFALLYMKNISLLKYSSTGEVPDFPHDPAER